MFGGHIWELAIILGLALVVFGPKRLPEIGGALGKGIREFKNSTSELSDSVMGSHDAPAQTPVPVAVAPHTAPVQSTAFAADSNHVAAPTSPSNAG